MEHVEDQDAGEQGLAALKIRLLTVERENAVLQSALRDSKACERMLGNELQHRVRNLLGVIRSIYRRTFESDALPEELPEHFLGRLDTVGRHQAGLVDLRLDGVDLEDMVRDELLRVNALSLPGLSIKGPPIRLRDKSLELMGLAIHELATNSIKFGALAGPGTLHIEWAITGPTRGRVLDFRWRESSVPLVASAPRPRGFGRQFIEEGMPYQIGATTSFALKPGGLECLIALPLPVRAADVSAAIDGGFGDPSPQQFGQSRG